MPQGWTPTRIGNICKTNQRTYSVAEKWPFVNYLETGNITENRVGEIQHIVIGQDTLPSRARRKVEVDDIIYSTVRPNQRHYGIVRDVLPNMLVSTGFTVITGDKEKVDSDFLYYYLTQSDIVDSLHAIGEQSVSAYPSIKPSDIESVELDLPPLPDQVEIGHTLRVLDDKIANNTKINNHLAQMAQAIFAEQCKQGETAVLSDILTVCYGKDHKRLGDGMTPCYGSGGIMRYVDAALYSGESVLIPRKGSLNNVLYINEPFWTVDTMFYTHMTRPNVAKFVYFTVRDLDLAGMNVGSAVPSMTTAVLNALEIVLPNDEVLASFEEIVSPMFLRMQANNVESARLVALRETLLPRLMSGELSVAAMDAK